MVNLKPRPEQNVRGISVPIKKSELKVAWGLGKTLKKFQKIYDRGLKSVCKGSRLKSDQNPLSLSLRSRLRLTKIPLASRFARGKG